MRFWKGWWSDNPSGSRPNFFGRQHLTFDKGGKGVGDFRGIVRFLEGLVQRSLSLATDKVERILKMLESQSKTIYGKK